MKRPLSHCKRVRKSVWALPAGRIQAGARLLLWLLALGSAIPGRAELRPGRFYEGQIEAVPGENFSFVQYQCWLPPTSRPLAGVLCVVLHPHGNRSVQLATPQPWLALASRHRCALLGVAFVEAADNRRSWSHAAEGSGRALAAVLTEAASRSGTEGLTRAPLVLAGVCQAGQFAYSFAAYAPTRMAAFLTVGGNQHELTLAAAAAAVPGLLVAAEDGRPPTEDHMRRLLAAGREHAAPWKSGRERLDEYDAGHCSAAVMDFLTTALMSLAGDTAADPPPVGAVEGAAAELSFVSVVRPAVGWADETRIPVGMIYLHADGAAAVTGTLHLHCDERSCVDGVGLADSNSVRWTAVRRGAAAWDLDFGLDLAGLPCGAFNVELPVRFLHAGDCLPGGVSVFVSGQLTGDVVASPATIQLDSTDSSPASCFVRLRSNSGAPVQIMHLETDPPGLLDLEPGHDPAAPGFTCRPAAHASREREEPISGHVLVRVTSDRAQTLRLFFFGWAPRSSQGSAASPRS